MSAAVAQPVDARAKVKRRRWPYWLGGLVAALAATYGVLVLVWRHPLPEGREGPEADAMARALEKALGGPAWARTGAVRWTFRTRHQHLWDRQRGFARVRWREADVLIDLTTRKGRAYRNQREVLGPEADALVQKGYAFWANDSFWLSAPFKLFEPGTRRAAVTLPDGRRALKVTFGTGGVTPGDHYLWILGDDGRPTAWRMWVSVLPIGGLETSILEWKTLPTGAQVAARHKLVGLLPVDLTDLAAAETLSALEPGADPFSLLAAPTR